MRFSANAPLAISEGHFNRDKCQAVPSDDIRPARPARSASPPPLPFQRPRATLLMFAQKMKVKKKKGKPTQTLAAVGFFFFFVCVNCWLICLQGNQLWAAGKTSKGEEKKKHFIMFVLNMFSCTATWTARGWLR